MQTKAATLQFNAVKTCFIALPKTWTTSLAREKVSIFQLQSDTASLYISWSGDVTAPPPGGQDENTVELNGLMAHKAGFLHGQKVILTAVPSTVVPSCESLILEPLSVDDWEILELNASAVESHLLDQVRVVAMGQVFPIWIQGAMCIFVRIGQLSVTAKCVLLEKRTQLVVSRKVRHHRPFVPSGGVQADHMTSDVEDVPQSNAESDAPFESPQSNTSGTIGNPAGILARCVNYIKSFNTGEQSPDQQVAPSVRDPFINGIRPRNLSDHFEMVLRVQPITEPDYTAEVFSSSRQREDNTEDERKDECIWQTTNVMIGIETLAQYCDVNYTGGPITAFPAVLQKILSPSEKEAATKEHLSHARLKSARNDNQAERSKLDAESSREETRIVVRVMVVNSDHSCIFAGSGCQVSFDTKPLVGHVMVSELLRQQLGAGVTSRVRLIPLMRDPQEVSGVQLRPVFKTPADINNQLVEMSFRAWLSRVTDRRCPLVLNRGTLVKFFIKPGYMGEYIVTFTPASSSKVKTADGLSNERCCYCLLTHDEGKQLKVTIVNSTDQKIGHHVSLRHDHFGKCDPVVPQESLLQLGSLDAVVDQLLDVMTLTMTQTPLAQKLSKCHVSGCPVHRVLVCGSKGTGKSHMTRAVCQKLASMPTLAYVSVVDCRALKGKRIESVRQHVRRVVAEAIWRSPSVILLDDLDHLTNEASNPEQEMNGEAQYSAYTSEVLQDVLGFNELRNTSIGIIATSQSRASIHPSFVAANGRHFFHEIIEIEPPTEEQRLVILQCLLMRKVVVAPSCVMNLDLIAVATKTEGFVARDLEHIVSRAIHAHLMARSTTEEVEKRRDLKELHLIDADFDQALIDYIPASLRNVPLHEAGEVGWQDIGGLASVKKVLIETLQWPSKYPRLFSACPLRLRSGLLLYGPSGTGKTLLAAAVAKECQLHFIHIKGPELLSKYIGASEQAVRNMFARAHSARPCALFFDEFDSLAPRRGHDSTGVTDRVVNQLLTQLDGVEGLEGVYVLAATSRPDLIDPALLRPGRIDKLLYCGMPTQEERSNILQVLTRNLQMAADVDLGMISEMCVNFTGADLKALLCNAQLEAIHEAIDVSAPGTTRRVDRTANMSDEASGISGIDTGATPLVAQQLTQQRVVTETNFVHIPALQDGLVEPSGDTVDRLQQQVQNHLMQLSDKLTNHPTRKRKIPVAIVIQQKHLLKAAGEIVPSVSLAERTKYKMIYDAFVAGKGGNFQHDEMSAGKRATLA